MTRHRPPQSLLLRARSLPSKVVIASSLRSAARSKQAHLLLSTEAGGDPSDLRGLVEQQRSPRHIDSRGARGPEREASRTSSLCVSRVGTREVFSRTNQI